MTMNAIASFPQRLNWTAQQLADAVPLRLSELFALDGLHNDGLRAANRETRRTRSATAYAPRPRLPQRFAIR
jgi:hypothetical protein